MTTTTTVPRTGVVERAVVGAGAVAAIVGAAWGSGAFGGTPIQEAADGAFAADATLLAPATPAFGIWSVIYTGLAAFAVVQALPGPGARARLRSVAWLVLAAMVLNAAWIAVVQQGLVVAAVGVLAAIVATLGWAVVRLARSRPDSWVQVLAVDVPVGLYLGWAAVATVANVTAAAVATYGLDADAGEPTAVGVLAAVAFLAIAIARDVARLPALAWATTAAMSWGLAWIGYGRLEATPASPAVGWAALGAAALAVLATAVTTVTTAVRRRRLRRGASS